MLRSVLTTIATISVSIIRRILRKIRNVAIRVHQVCHDRDRLVTLGIHLPIHVASTIRVVPFVYSESQNDQQQLALSVAKGWRRVMCLVFETMVVLRVLCVYSLCLNKKFHWTYDEYFTGDAVTYVLLLVCCSWPIIASPFMHLWGPELCQLYNATRRLTGRFAEKYYNKPGLLQAFSGQLLVKFLAIIFVQWTLIAPVAAICCVATLNSVMLMRGQLNNWIGIRDTQDFTACLAINAFDTVSITALSAIAAGFTAVCLEVMTLANLLATALRSGRCKGMGWEEQRFYHVQLEIVQHMINDFAKHIISILLCGVTTATVAANVLILKLHEVPDRPLVVLRAVFIALTSIATVTGCAGCVLLGGLRVLSMELLNDIELEIMKERFAAPTGSARRGKVESPRFTARRYGRRPLGIKLGIFMYAEEGLGVDFLRSIFDNTVNWLFMVTLQSNLWLF